MPACDTPEVSPSKPELIDVVCRLRLALFVAAASASVVAAARSGRLLDSI
jgi:hypothetical protein